jgi:hypothetical protein
MLVLRDLIRLPGTIQPCCQLSIAELCQIAATVDAETHAPSGTWPDPSTLPVQIDNIDREFES